MQLNPNAKYCVGLNFRSGNIETLMDRYGNRIYEVYAAAPAEVCNTGRRGHVWSTLAEITRQTKIAQANGVQFNIVMNASCQGGLEFSTPFQRRIIDFIKFSDDVGVDSVTVCNPFMIDLIRKHSDIGIVAGSIGEITDPLRVERYINHGVNRVVLHWNVYRNFEMLKEIRASTDIPLEIIVNQGCLHACESFYAHANITAHSSALHDDKIQKLGDYYMPVKSCRMIRQTDPIEFLMSCFIRPEDLNMYEDRGYTYFKFAGRRSSTEWMINVLDAYMQRSYDGNVFDLSSHVGENKKLCDLPNKVLDGWLEAIGSNAEHLQFEERARAFCKERKLNTYFEK